MKAVKATRSVSHQMMPNAPSKAGWCCAVREFIDKIDNCINKINPAHRRGLNERPHGNTETVLYRAIQECGTTIAHPGRSSDIALIKDADGPDPRLLKTTAVVLDANR